MDFKTDKPIYKQIIDLCFSRIINSEWSPDTKLPSVREMSIELAVNARTVLSAFDELQDAGIIYSQRGIGYFLAPDAPEKVRMARTVDFFNSRLPALFEEMYTLGISVEQVADALRNLNDKSINHHKR